jgi:hypothetical protein
MPRRAVCGGISPLAHVNYGRQLHDEQVALWWLHHSDTLSSHSITVYFGLDSSFCSGRD